MITLLSLFCIAILGILIVESLWRIEDLLKREGFFVRTTSPPATSRPVIYKPPLPMVAFLLCGLSAIGEEPRTDPPMQCMHLEPSTRAWYWNPDGSCVQCSIGMAGCHCNDLNAACLLWDTPFGKAERLGSNPSRVAHYCDARGIVVYNVTGTSINETMPWIEWSAKTGRFCAVALSEQHFQTLYGFDSSKREYLVCNNQTPNRIDRYSEQQFRDLHARCMPWVVILEKPSSPPPKIIYWWK